MTGRDAATAPPSRRERGGGVYVHVPFCSSICSYCHFARTDRHDRGLRQRTVAGILAEVDLRTARCPSLGRSRVDTLYVGGGTPSLLGADLSGELLRGLASRLRFAPDAEITLEANPESFTPDLVDAWRGAGANRVSLGVQSLDRGTLDLLGRRCGPDDARRALRLAGERFERVSADWILAPGVTAARLADEFAEARDLGVGHVSFYILEWHDGTPLTEAAARGAVKPDPDERTAATYLEALEALERLGYRQYEVSNASLPRQESRHNRAYWSGRPYLGLGPSAHGFWGRRRYANVEDPAAWLEAVEGGAVPEAMIDHLDADARRLERRILGLRTVDGIPVADAGLDAAVLDHGVREELWTTADGRLRLTPLGFLRIDDVEARLA